MRTVLVVCIAIIATACIQRPAPVAPQQPVPVVAAAPAPAPKPAELAKPEPPRNFVCEAFKGVNDKAKCEPYVTTAEAQTAMITLSGGQQLHCTYTLKGVECHDPIIIVQQPPPPTQDKKPEARKPAKGGAK